MLESIQHRVDVGPFAQLDDLGEPIVERDVLRRVVGCTLPIELWHLGPSELGSLEAALFATLDVEIVDAHEV